MKFLKRGEETEPAEKSDTTGERCDVIGCTEPAHRAVSAKNAMKAGLKVKKERGKAHLCKKHYKEYKKATKMDRKLERLGR